MIPIDLIKLPALLRAYVTSLLAFAAQMVGLVALPFYLQGRLGYGHLETGLLITCFPIGVAIAAPFSGRLADRSSGWVGPIGFALMAIGYGLLALGSGAGALLMMCLALAGVGMGLFQSPNNRTMLSEAPRARSGAAAGMMAVVRILGQTLGALLAVLLFRLAGTTSIAAFAAASVLGVAGLLASIRTIQPGARADNHYRAPRVTK